MIIEKCKIKYPHDFDNYPCRICRPEEYENWVKDRADRKALFIAKATAHFDTPEIRKEASDMWEEANKID